MPEEQEPRGSTTAVLTHPPRPHLFLRTLHRLDSKVVGTQHPPLVSADSALGRGLRAAEAVRDEDQDSAQLRPRCFQGLEVRGQGLTKQKGKFHQVAPIKAGGQLSGVTECRGHQPPHSWPHRRHHTISVSTATSTAHQHPCLHHSQPSERCSLGLNALENLPSTESTSFLSAAAGPSLLLLVQQPPAPLGTVYT